MNKKKPNDSKEKQAKAWEVYRKANACILDTWKGS
jgi:hypothetical protein